MLTIKTKPDCTLGFVDEAHIRHYMIFPEKGDSSWRPPTIIGKLSEITEDQAKELVEKFGTSYKFFPHKQIGLELRPIWITGNTPGGKMDTYYLNAIHSLYSAAQSVGIEEKDFDKYLVVKL